MPLQLAQGFQHIKLVPIVVLMTMDEGRYLQRKPKFAEMQDSEEKPHTRRKYAANSKFPKELGTVIAEGLLSCATVTR